MTRSANSAAQASALPAAPMTEHGEPANAGRAGGPGHVRSYRCDSPAEQIDPFCMPELMVRATTAAEHIGRSRVAQREGNDSA